MPAAVADRQAGRPVEPGPALGVGKVLLGQVEILEAAEIVVDRTYHASGPMPRQDENLLTRFVRITELQHGHAGIGGLLGGTDRRPVARVLEVDLPPIEILSTRVTKVTVDLPGCST